MARIAFCFPDQSEDGFYVGDSDPLPRVGEEVLFTWGERRGETWRVDRIEHHYGERGLSVVGIDLEPIPTEPSGRERAQS